FVAFRLTVVGARSISTNHGDETSFRRPGGFVITGGRRRDEPGAGRRTCTGSGGPREIPGPLSRLCASRILSWVFGTVFGSVTGSSFRGKGAYHFRTVREPAWSGDAAAAAIGSSFF